MALQYFGTDGIRGTAGVSPMDAVFVRKLGWAASQVLRSETDQNPVFVVGRDTRASGAWLQNALTAGLVQGGARVLDLGVIPTPGIAFLSRKPGVAAGAVISASHNPASENGIKFIDHEGIKLSEAQEAAIEALLEQAPPEVPELDTKAEDASHLAKEYEQDLLKNVPGLDLGGMTILLDCANGANSFIAPRVLRGLGANLIALNTTPDGVNINDHAGSEFVRSEPHLFAQKIRENQADIGIAFDGDADRVILFDEQGRMVDGDGMLAIAADDLHARGVLLGDALVTTIMANGSLHGFTERRGFSLTETPVGDKYVTEKLLALAAQGKPGQVGVGGEQSGHIVLLDQDHHTGDGLRTALFILQVLRRVPGTKLSDLTGQLDKFPQLIASCNVGSKPKLETLPRLSAALENLKHELPGLVRQNARYSGTEPKFRLMLETDTRHTPADVARVAWRICDLIQAETGTPSGAKVEVLNVSDGGLMPRPTV